MPPQREHFLRVTIKDCDVQTFRAGGKGGQNQNKRDSGVRVIHRPSGAVGEAREGRGQLENKRKAFRKMGESLKFKNWVYQQMDTTRSVDEIVDIMMQEQNLLVENVNATPTV